MGILLCCLRVPEHNNESQNVPRIRELNTSPVTNNLSSKYEELLKSLERGEVSSVADEEDICPTCFYEYVKENPKINLQCGHIFHLGCIYEWMERSEACPFCSKKMVLLEGDENTEKIQKGENTEKVE